LSSKEKQLWVDMGAQGLSHYPLDEGVDEHLNFCTILDKISQSCNKIATEGVLLW